MGFLEERCNKQLIISVITTLLVVGLHFAYLNSKDTENVWKEMKDNAILYVVVFIGTYLVFTTRAQDACTSKAKPMSATTSNLIAVNGTSYNNPGTGPRPVLQQ